MVLAGREGTPGFGQPPPGRGHADGSYALPGIRKGARLTRWSSSRGLVSSLYWQAPSDDFPDREEGERRLKMKMQRLVTEFGEEEVVRRLRAAVIPNDQEYMRAWMVLSAYAAAKRRDTLITPKVPV